MKTVELETTQVGKIVAQHPQVARVFEKYQLDYCCRGAQPLADACRRNNLDLAQVTTEIQQILDSGDSVDTTDWADAPLSDLSSHIVDTHHRFLNTELPRISGLVAKVKNAHGENHPELAKVAETFELMRSELESHMAKEENILFPAVELLESEHRSGDFPFGSVANPIGMMEHEHDDAGNALRRLRELTDNYTPPADACPTWRVMLEALLNLEQDLHLHIHKENNILFPRAIQLEADLR